MENYGGKTLIKVWGSSFSARVDIVDDDQGNKALFVDLCVIFLDQEQVEKIRKGKNQVS